MTLRDTFADNRGVANGLLEVVLVIVIVATLASVVVGSGLDRLQDANEARAAGEVREIAMAVHSFMQDTGVAPAFKSGLATTPADDVFFVLETEGDDAIDETDTWPTDADERDLLENHLMMNEPDGTGPSYPGVGEISFNRQKGWNGPYFSNVPVGDPWADRYLVNVQFLTLQGVDLVREGLAIPTGGRVAVVVLSAGANRTIETRFDQLSESFEADGDDIIFRIQ